jgi:hypothetical protein
MPDDLQTLEDRDQKARKAARRAKDGLDSLIHSRTEAQRTVIAAWLHAERGDEIARLLKEATDARLAFESALVLDAASQLAAMGDLRRVEWRRARRYSRELDLSGRTGRVEIRTRETQFPANASDYSLPSIGSLFLRINKKDGTPSLLFERMGRDFETGRWRDSASWHPVGWSPSDAR